MSKNQVKVKKQTFKFAPQVMSRKDRINYGITSFRARSVGYHAWQKRPLNEIVLGRLSGVIHSAVSHGLPKTALRWKAADIRFSARFPKRSSCAYANTYSAHRFL
jgi:hypothetical protein